MPHEFDTAIDRRKFLGLGALGGVLGGWLRRRRRGANGNDSAPEGRRIALLKRSRSRSKAEAYSQERQDKKGNRRFLGDTSFVDRDCSAQLGSISSFRKPIRPCFLAGHTLLSFPTRCLEESDLMRFDTSSHVGPRFYPDRIARRHRHHRSLDRLVVVEAVQSAREAEHGGPSAPTTSSRSPWPPLNYEEQNGTLPDRQSHGPRYHVREPLG